MVAPTAGNLDAMSFGDLLPATTSLIHGHGIYLPPSGRINIAGLAVQHPHAA